MLKLLRAEGNDRLSHTASNYLIFLVKWRQGRGRLDFRASEQAEVPRLWRSEDLLGGRGGSAIEARTLLHTSIFTFTTTRCSSHHRPQVVFVIALIPAVYFILWLGIVSHQKERNDGTKGVRQLFPPRWQSRLGDWW